MIYQWFDVAAALFLTACVLYSAFRGVMKELFCVLAWIAGYAGAITLHPLLATYFRKHLEKEILIDLASFFSVFIALYLVVRIIGFVLRKKAFLKHIPSSVDHGLGAAMGAAKFVFFLAIFLSPLNLFPDVKAKLVSNSVMAGVVMDVSRQVMSMVGTELGASRSVGSAARRGAAKETRADKSSGNLGKMITEKKRPVDEAPDDALTEQDRQEMDDLLKTLQ